VRDMLELVADRIELTLEEFGVAGRVIGGAVLPQVIVFELQAGPGQRFAQIKGLREELAMRLEVPGVLISRRDGAIRVEVPRAKRAVVTLTDMLRQLKEQPPTQTMLLGLSENALPLLAHLPSPNVAHILIAGMTGSGKTELLRTMLVSLSLWSDRQAMIYLIDPKGHRLAELSALRSVMEVCGARQAPALLERLLAEMERRGGRGGRHHNHIYVAIDELADLVMVDRAVEVGLTRLVQRGREAAMHVVAATQRPSAQVMAGLMKANFPIRITGAVASAAEASIATGLPQSGAELLLGKGDMVLAHRGKCERFQACMVEDWSHLAISENAPVDKESASLEKGEVVDLVGRLRDRLGLRGPGRPSLGFTEEMIQFALGQMAATGECTQRALREWHKARYGQDINPPRAAAAIEEAERRFLELSGKGQGLAGGMKFWNGME